MKLGRCPVCHSHLHLDQLVADEAGRQLLNQLARMNYKLGGNMVAYLAMFRPAKQDLSNTKALSLVQETLALTSNQPALTEALEQAVASLQQSRVSGTGKQLTNHNYLKKVLVSKLDQAPAATGSTIEYRSPPSSFSKEEEKRRWAEQMARYGVNVPEVPHD